MTMEKNPDCFRCKHFYVTWKESAPRGCKFFGFKTKNIPSVEVARISGHPCLSFEDKKSPKSDKIYF
jgi:hypothetical protein